MNNKKSIEIARDIFEQLEHHDCIEYQTLQRLENHEQIEKKAIDIIQGALMDQPMDPELAEHLDHLDGGEPTQSRYEQVKRLAFAKKYRMIRVKYLGPTTYRESRVKLYDADGRVLSENVTIPYDHKYNSCLEIAVDYLLDRGFNVQGVVQDHVLIEWTYPYRRLRAGE